MMNSGEKLAFLQPVVNWRGGHGSYLVPSKLKPAPDEMDVAAKLSRPLGDSKGFPVMSYFDIASFVVLLGILSCPSAILRRIPLGIVNAIY